MTESTIKFIPYTSAAKQVWDSFVDEAKNSYFFFKRDFMEYHADRFNDYSLMIYYDDKLLALLPAHKIDKKLYTHMGLTFGGFILSPDIKLVKMLEIFSALRVFLLKDGFEELVYKAVPYVYHTDPCDEDIFALHKNGAEISCRDLTSVIKLGTKIEISKGKRSAAKKARKEGVEVKETKDLKGFFAMMEELLKSKYQTKPVHSLNEMELLAKRFPENIKLFSAYQNETMLAGVLVFEDQRIVKTQYISSIEEGRKLGAVDLIIERLLKEVYKDKEYFDFGTSTEKNEFGFNESLLAQKELFGARTVAKDVYTLNLSKEKAYA